MITRVANKNDDELSLVTCYMNFFCLSHQLSIMSDSDPASDWQIWQHSRKKHSYILSSSCACKGFSPGFMGSHNEKKSW